MMQNCNILYVCSGRSFHSGNPGRKISSVVECWRQMGHKVLHVCGGDILEEAGGGKALAYGADSHYRQWYRRTGILDPIIRSISERRDIRHHAAIVRHLAKHCESFRPNVIWERSCRLHCAGLVSARRLGVPYVLEWKDHLVDYRFSLFRRKALRMERRKNQDADFIVVESGVLRDELGRKGVDIGKIIVAHNAVYADQFTRDNDRRLRARKELGVDSDTILVGYLGSYAFYHDTARLVLAADILRKHGACGKIRVLMVGAGMEYPASRRLAESLGLLEGMLTMKPGVPKDEVPGILAALDIAVLPGSTDIICPIKIQEYMACELPSVVPDYACNREVLRDGETGMLFKPKDAEALAAKIVSLSVSKKQREEMGKRAREEAMRRFSWGATWGAALKTVLERQCGKSEEFDANLEV